MEDKDEEVAATPPLEQRICGVERQELLAIASREDDTPAAAIAIGGQAVIMNVEGQPEHFGQSLQSADGAAGSSAGGSAAAASPLSFSPGAILGLTSVSAAAASARGGRDAELQSKGKHGGNAFRLEPGNCHQLSNPNVLNAYFLAHYLYKSHTIFTCVSCVSIHVVYIRVYIHICL